MEKLILRGLFAGNKLDIVHQKQIDVSVLCAELLCLAVFDGFDHLVCEFVALDVRYGLFG